MTIHTLAIATAICLIANVVASLSRPSNSKEKYTTVESLLFIPTAIFQIWLLVAILF